MATEARLCAILPSLHLRRRHLGAFENLHKPTLHGAGGPVLNSPRVRDSKTVSNTLEKTLLFASAHTLDRTNLRLV